MEDNKNWLWIFRAAMVVGSFFLYGLLATMYALREQVEILRGQLRRQQQRRQQRRENQRRFFLASYGRRRCGGCGAGLYLSDHQNDELLSYDSVTAMAGNDELPSYDSVIAMAKLTARGGARLSSKKLLRLQP